ncbi:type I site-specific deoxyribonuclease [Actinobacillus pleuropneumoniae]|nr:type I site-specific deoxyribonuclease [Actinobacillus pleuropneumoniae]
MNWARSDNTLIKDLKDFTATFFQKNTLLNVLLTYSVFDVSETLLIMRPYQIAATGADFMENSQFTFGE